MVPAVNAAVGVNVATRVAALYASPVDTGVAPGPVKKTFAAMMLVPCIASLNVTVTVVAGTTPTAPFAGVTAVTVGGVVSTVNVDVKSATIVFPARSVTPVAPLFTVTV